MRIVRSCLCCLASLLISCTAFAAGTMYGGVEIGAKGINASAVEVDSTAGGTALEILELPKKTVDVTIARLKGKEFESVLIDDVAEVARGNLVGSWSGSYADEGMQFPIALEIGDNTLVWTASDQYGRPRVQRRLGYTYESDVLSAQALETSSIVATIKIEWSGRDQFTLRYLTSANPGQVGVTIVFDRLSAGISPR